MCLPLFQVLPQMWIMINFSDLSGSNLFEDFEIEASVSLTNINF